MKREGYIAALSACLALVGCQEEKSRTAAPRPTPPDVQSRVAKFSICSNATFMERKALDGQRERLLFLDNGSVSVENIRRFENELAAGGWKSKGTRPVASDKYPAQNENVYEKAGSEMSYWVGGSAGFQMIGITLPRQEEIEANQPSEATR